MTKNASSKVSDFSRFGKQVCTRAFHRPCREADAGFSLFELLTVLALIGILVGLTVGGIGVLRGRSLVAAGNQVTSLFELARQRALSGNVLTAAVLVINSGGDHDGRAFSIFEYTGSNGVWKQVGAWEILPEGLCVELGNTTTEGTFVSRADPAGGLPYATGSPVVFRGTPLTSSQYAFRVFLPNGGLWSDSGSVTRLQLVEGSVENGITHRKGELGNCYRIAIVTATGIAKVSQPDF